jgi:4-hydroxybenzoate polyprenyltransferase
MGSTSENHLTGKNKAVALCARFGENGFDYLGDSPRDLPVWEKARHAYFVRGGKRTEAALLAIHPQAECVGETEPKARLRTAARLLRIHQWVKNILVFAPAVSSHRIMDASVLLASLACFAAFCCCSSAAYILNDLMDLESDRRHVRKRGRPMAAGLVSIPQGALTAALLLAGALGFATRLPAAGGSVIGLYFLVTLLYSTVLKQIALLDVLTLAGLYCLRVLAGGAAASIRISEWTVAFFLFLFLSLALLKRFTELSKMPGDGAADEVPGRGYARSDINFISQAGVSSGMVSVLVLALYIHSPEVFPLYKRPDVLWLICPLLGYGILSLWLTGHRRKMDDDPVVFAATQPIIWGLAGAAAALLAAASL